MVEHSLAKAEVEGSSPSFRSRLRRLVVTSVRPFRDRGEQQAAPCIGFQTYLPNKNKGASQNLVLTSCWLFISPCALAFSLTSKGLLVVARIVLVNRKSEFRLLMTDGG